MRTFADYLGLNRSFLPVIEVSCSTSKLLSSAVHEDFLRALRWSLHEVCCIALCPVSRVVFTFPPPGQHLSTPVQADHWAVLWMRTLQLQERMVQPAGSRQIPGWRRGESGHRGTEITWAGRTCTLLPIYLKDMVCKLKFNCRALKKEGNWVAFSDSLVWRNRPLWGFVLHFLFLQLLIRLDFTEQRTTQQGQVYFLHTQTGVSTWHDPRVPR